MYIHTYIFIYICIGAEIGAETAFGDELSGGLGGGGGGGHLVRLSSSSQSLPAAGGAFSVGFGFPPAGESSVEATAAPPTTDAAASAMTVLSVDSRLKFTDDEQAHASGATNKKDESAEAATHTLKEELRKQKLQLELAQLKTVMAAAGKELKALYAVQAAIRNLPHLITTCSVESGTKKSELHSCLYSELTFENLYQPSRPSCYLDSCKR